MKSLAGLVACCLALAAGCEATRGSSSAGLSDAGRAATGRPADAGRIEVGPVSPCSQAAKTGIYVVDTQDTLLRFTPGDLRLLPVGALRCEPSGVPFSMSVDRSGTAWVLYESGRLYQVSTADASCAPTSFSGASAGFSKFGMGFVSDGPQSETETLYVAGGATISADVRLASVNLGALSVRPIGSLPAGPELTGTGDGELYGFFALTRPPTIQGLDRATGASISTLGLSELADPNPSGGNQAWAFAFWGGGFYIFFKRSVDPTTQLWRLEPTSGRVERLLQDTGRIIRGAGVSTCAPTKLI